MTPRAIMANRKPRKTWAADPKAAVSDALRAELERKANELLETLRPKHIKPPPEKAELNYVIELETNFARLEHVGGQRFDLSFLRHTGKWWPLLHGVTLDECLKSVRDDPWFQP